MKALIWPKAANTSVTDVSRNFTYDQILVRAENIKRCAEYRKPRSSQWGTRPRRLRERATPGRSKQTQGIQLALGGIGGVSGLVAAIGIAKYDDHVGIGTERINRHHEGAGCYVRDIRVTFCARPRLRRSDRWRDWLLISAFGSLGINLVALRIQLGGTSSRPSWATTAISRIAVIPWWLFAAATVFSIAACLRVSDRSRP